MEKWSSRPSIALLENWLDSTHIVWERLSAMHYHIPVTRIFGSKVLECPHSSIWGMWCLEYPPPHWKLSEILGLWVWLGPEYPSPLPRNENLARLRDFGFQLVQKTPPPLPPRNGNLARLRGFGFELVQKKRWLGQIEGMPSRYQGYRLVSDISNRYETKMICGNQDNKMNLRVVSINRRRPTVKLLRRLQKLFVTLGSFKKLRWHRE